MPEPLAVAFIEVRPELDEFRSNAEQELKAGLGDDAVQVQGQFKLNGIDEAQAQVTSLTDDLQSVAGGQLQFTGLETAAAEAQTLKGALEEAAAVDLSSGIRPATSEAAALAQNAEAAASAIQSIPSQATFNVQGLSQTEAEVAAIAEETQAAIDALSTATSPQFAQGFVAGAQEAVATALELGQATEDVNTTTLTGAAARRTYAEANATAAASEKALEAATRSETRATIEADAAQRDLIRTGSRRSSALGPLRFAGVGLGAGVALFAATQGLRDLGEALEVTGDEASTFEGKTRNAFASLLRGDLVGTFQALTNNTRTYSIEQLKLINQTPQLAADLRELGQAANIARSAQGALAGLSQPPQFLQTALVREEAQGDTAGQIRVLEKQLADRKAAEDTARQVATSTAELNAILEPIFAQEASIREKLARLISGGTRGGGRATRVAAATTAGTGILAGLKAELEGLQKEKDELRTAIPQGRTAGDDLAALHDDLAGINQKIELERDRIIAEQDRHAAEIRGAGAEDLQALVRIQVAGDEGKELALLQRERAELVAAIAKKEVEASALAGSKGRLGAVNAAIEAAVAEIRAEQDRHMKALIDGGLIGSLDTKALENEARGDSGGQLRSLQAEALLIQGLLPILKATDTTTSGLYEEYLARLVSLNSRIEGIQDGITSETKRHATDSKQKTDDADQAFLDSLDPAIHRANLRQMAAEATAGLGDDIQVSNDLQRIYERQIAQAAKRIHDKQLRDTTIARLTEQLQTEAQNERSLRQQRRAERISRQEESLDLDIELAQAKENTRAEIRAHEAKIRFLSERIRHTRANTNQRKQLRVEIAREREEIRRLKEEASDDSDSDASFGQIATDFLKQLHGFSSNLATNTFPRGSQISGASTGTFTSGFSTPRPQERVFTPVVLPGEGLQGPAGPRGPFDGRGGTSTGTTKAAEDLRSSRGAPVNQSQGEELIHYMKQSVMLLKKIEAGQGHNEAHKARKLGRHAQTPGVD